MLRSSSQGQGHSSKIWTYECNVLVTCELKLFRNYFSLRRTVRLK